MKIRYLLILCSFFILFTGQLTLADSDPIFHQKRIVGGNIVTSIDNPHSSIEQWPWVVALIDQNNSHFCGASLVDAEWLMTAAHCLYDSGGRNNSRLKITALFKLSDLSELDDQTLSREVIQTIVHPGYSFFTDNNDIALLKLDAPITDIKPVNLPGEFFDAPITAAGTIGTVLGWGSTPSFSNTLLRQAQIPIADPQECTWNYAKLGIVINQNMLCAGFDEGGVDACSGDSGGPLVIPHESGTGWKQLGIVSFGVGCAEPDFFGVYTRISRYHDFIQSHICQQQPDIPQLTIQRDKSIDSITFNIAPAPGKHTGHRIYFAPYPELTPILHYDLADSNTITTTIGDDQAFYAVAQAMHHNCSSDYSKVILSQ